MFIVDVDIENGGLSLNRDFNINFGKEPQGGLETCTSLQDVDTTAHVCTVS